MDKNLLLIQCRDKVGLVSAISHIISKFDCNITSMREFVDEPSKQFFTRVEFAGEITDKDLLLRDLQNVLPQNSTIKINPKSTKRIVVLVTKEYHCLGDILTRHFFQSLHAEVCAVIGNHDVLQKFAESFSLPYHYVSHENKPKEDFEKELKDIINNYSPDYIVLAKFMRILSPEFVAGYAEKIINIHHSFLPAFIGANPYRKAFERGVKLIGATAHFVTNDLDEGPIIAQQTIHVNHTFTANDMVTAGKEIETAVLSKAMQLVFQDRVFISGNKTIVFE